MKPKSLVIASLFSMALITGCSSNSASPAAEPTNHQHEHTAVQHAENGDLQELTASIQTLPKFLSTLDPRITQAYQIAAEHRELLQSMPCYCGCGESAGHKSNYNCFIKEEHEDGSVVWDDHGTRCGTCMEIAVVTAQLSQEGKSAKEIRTIIDDAFKEGYAPPTPTPMPM